MLGGEDVSGWEFTGEVTDVPDKVHEWVEANRERIERAAERGTLPYWVEDNPKYVGGAAVVRQQTEQVSAAKQHQ